MLDDIPDSTSKTLWEKLSELNRKNDRKSVEIINEHRDSLFIEFITENPGFMEDISDLRVMTSLGEG